MRVIFNRQNPGTFSISAEPVFDGIKEASILISAVKKIMEENLEYFSQGEDQYSRLPTIEICKVLIGRVREISKAIRENFKLLAETHEISFAVFSHLDPAERALFSQLNLATFLNVKRFELREQSDRKGTKLSDEEVLSNLDFQDIENLSSIKEDERISELVLFAKRSLALFLDYEGDLEDEKIQSHLYQSELCKLSLLSLSNLPINTKINLRTLNKSCLNFFLSVFRFQTNKGDLGSSPQLKFFTENITLKKFREIINYDPQKIGEIERLNYPYLLQLFSKMGDLEGLRFCRDVGINVNLVADESIDSKRFSALMFAKNRETAAFLLDEGAKINQRNNYGTTAVMLSLNDIEKMELLLERGADVRLKNGPGSTVLLEAAKSSSFKAVKLLLPRMTVLDRLESDNNQKTFLHLALANLGSPDEEIRREFKKIAQDFIEIMESEYLGKVTFDGTALHYAVRAKDLDILFALVNKMNPEHLIAKSELHFNLELFGETALHLLIRSFKGKADYEPFRGLIELMLRKNPRLLKIGRDIDQKTVLDLARVRGIDKEIEHVLSNKFRGPFSKLRVNFDK